MLKPSFHFRDKKRLGKRNVWYSEKRKEAKNGSPYLPTCIKVPAGIRSGPRGAESNVVAFGICRIPRRFGAIVVHIGIFIIFLQCMRLCGIRIKMQSSLLLSGQFLNSCDNSPYFKMLHKRSFYCLFQTKPLVHCLVKTNMQENNFCIYMYCCIIIRKG
jgi:hypothetical protein